MPDRVVARRAFLQPNDRQWMGQVNPLLLGQYLAHDSPFDRVLIEVRVYRGFPAAERDPRGYAAVRRRLSSRTTSRLITPVTRPLRYPNGWPDHCGNAAVEELRTE